MTFKKLASAIAKREGKKSQARISDIREILSILSDIIAEDASLKNANTFIMLFDNGKKRTKKKNK